MLSEKTANLVVDSFRAITPQRETVIENFYAKLFVAHPAMQSIFAKVDKAGLRRKLLLALITIVDSLDDNEQLYLSLQAIAETHHRNHIKREYYELFGAILIETLAEALPQQWTSHTAQAWKDALEHVTEMILQIEEHEA